MGAPPVSVQPGPPSARPPGSTFRSLPARWAAGWRDRPDAPVLRVGEGRWLSGRELDERSAGTAERLGALGVSAGDRVLWCTATSVEAIVGALGVLRLGAVLVPANPAYTRGEISYLASDVRPACALVDAHDVAAWVLDASPPTVVVDERLAPWPDGGAAPSGGRPGPLDQAAADDAALIVYTSGTTGRAKGAVLSHANVAAGVGVLVDAWGWSPDDRLLIALPLFHVHGLCAALFGSLSAGAPAMVHERFDADRVLAAARGEATMFFGVPTMYHRLMGRPDGAALGSLRLCVSGSAPLPVDLFAELERRTGRPVLERYGMSETLLTISNPLHGERRAGSVGLALPGVELALDDGELLVRGPSVFGGYFERPGATAEAFTAQGWFRTGDLAALGADDYVTILGRASELIISGGLNVYPAEVEAAVRRHPAVREVAVTGTPSPEWGEAVTAWVVVEGDAPGAEELAAFCADSLAAYKRPRLVRAVETLPRNALGKVVRRDLR